MVPLSNGLGPCYFRFGGTTADQLIFQPGNGTSYWPNTTMAEYNFTSVMLDELYSYAKSSGWRLIYDLNLALFNGSNWDSTNAQTFLNYASSHGYAMDFELGNEPDAYSNFNISITGQQIAEAYAKLRSILNGYNLYKNSTLVGPEVSYPPGDNILRDFILNGGTNSANAVTFHHYYFCGTNITVNSYINTTVMEGLQNYIGLTKNITAYTNYTGPVWLSETSADWCGTAKNLTTSYADGFLWLDKIGLSAKNRIGAVIRETIDALMTRNGSVFGTTPDYWVSFLHKKLVGTQVFGVTTNVNSSTLRLYGGSSKNTDGFIVYGINVANNSQTINLTQITNPQVTIYILQEAESGNLQSLYSNLNGQLLEWYSHDPVANINGNRTTLPVEIPPYSQFFIQVGQSKVTQCPNGWFKESTNSSKCLKISSNFTQPWFGANFDCTTYGINASFLSIDNAFENSEILGLLSNSTCAQFYVGLYKNQSNWIWSNGDASGYRNWLAGHPTNDNTKNCVIFDAKTGNWSNSDCDLSQCYICQIYVT